MTYKAVVCMITSIREHPNADRLQLATVLWHQVIVGLDYEVGQIGVYFPTDGQLSEEFAQANDLIRRKNPATGKTEGGFFESNRRVRALRLRGEDSDGFFAPLSMFVFAGDTSLLTIGTEFDRFNGVNICNKYETPATKRAKKKQGIGHRRETLMFRMHDDTRQYAQYMDVILVDSLVTITEKLHGTSHRYGHVLDTIPLKHQWLRKLLRMPLTRREWRYLSGTRRVVLEKFHKETFYGDESFRHNACKPLMGNLHQGEVVYMEIVGYTTTGAAIMGKQSTAKIQDKALRKDVQGQYGKEMVYHYGNEPGLCKAYVYRIVRYSADGAPIELSWVQVKARCAELGIDYVPEIYQGIIHTPSHLKILQHKVDEWVKGPSLLTDKHIREGVVIRVDAPTGRTYWLKHKSWLFKYLEGIVKENDNYVDMEEAA